MVTRGPPTRGATATTTQVYSSIPTRPLEKAIESHRYHSGHDLLISRRGIWKRSAPITAYQTNHGRGEFHQNNRGARADKLPTVTICTPYSSTTRLHYTRPASTACRKLSAKTSSQPLRSAHDEPPVGHTSMLNVEPPVAASLEAPPLPPAGNPPTTHQSTCYT